MHRFTGAIVALLLLSACAPAGLNDLQNSLVATAREQLERTLATQLTRELGQGVGNVIDELARPGGYLDNPLVRILLPPPTGLILDLAREMDGDPQASLLEHVMNAAAEQAIPGAAPILRLALEQISPAEAYALLKGDKTAVTEFLKAKTGEAVLAAVMPSIATTLGGNAAPLLYNELLDVYRMQQAATESEAAMPPEATIESEATMPAEAVVTELGQYVAEQAVEGLFRNLGVQETQIRARLDEMTVPLLQSVGMGSVISPAVR